MNRAASVVFLLTLTLASGCAQIPALITQAPDQDLQLMAVQQDVSRYAGRPVRWGGTVTSVVEDDEGIWIEIQQHALDRFGAPNPGGESDGRFLARLSAAPPEKAFVPGDDLTVFGSLDGVFSGSIGHEDYQFPVVLSEENYQWATRRLPASHSYRQGFLYPYPAWAYGHGHFYRHLWYRPYAGIYYPHLYLY